MKSHVASLLSSVALAVCPWIVAAADAGWSYPECGISVSGTMSFVREKDELAIGPCPERHPQDRLALTDSRGQVCGYVTFQRDGGRRSFYVHQVGSGGARKSLVGRFSYEAELACDASAIACRVKPVAKDERVFTFGTVGADALDNDAIFIRETDTLVRFEAEGSVRIETLAPGRFKVVLSGEDDGDYAIAVVRDYFRNRNMPHYRPIDRRRAPHAPTGWMAWNIYFDQATAEDNLKEARIGAKVLKPFGLEFWSIESWQGNSDVLPVAQFHNLDRSCNTKQFPQGMKAVADEIRALGFRPGLWIVPWGTGNEAFYRAHRDWFVHEPDGRPTRLWPGRYILDYTNDEAYEHVKAMIRSYAEDWGYEFFKIDGMGAGFGWPSVNLMRPEIRKTLAHPDRVDPVYRWTHMFREAMGEDRYFLACGAALTSPGLEDCDATRIGGDIVDPNRPVTWKNVLNQARATLRRYYAHNIVAWNDPDTLMVDPKALTLEEARVTATVVGLPGQVMFSGDKITELPPERLRLVQNDLPVVDTHPMRLYPVNDLRPVWNLRVVKPFQRWNVVALFNWGEEAREISATFAELGLDGSKEYAVYETWTDQNLGFVRNGFAMRIPAHAVRLFVVHERADRPIFLTSDRHITRGAEDVTDFRANADGSVSVTARTVAGFRSTVKVLRPDGTIVSTDFLSDRTGEMTRTLPAPGAAITTFVGVSERDPRYFRTREGETWVPVGMNICFERLGLPREEARAKFDAWMTEFAKNGGNFMRVWLSTPWTDIMPAKAYEFNREAEENLVWLVRRAEALGIRLKFTLEHFRGTKDVKTEFKDNQHLVSFQKPLYLQYASTMREFYASGDCYDAYMAKARRLKELGLGDSPAVIAWETWNEINSTGVDTATWMAWSAKACAELKRLFPNQMTLTNLGSYSAPTAYLLYEGLAKTENNDFLQIHRYLDLGAQIDACRGPMDVLAAQSVRDLRELSRDRPLVVAEVGAVQANHAGPSKLYEKDREGTLLHDAVFAPFFAGSAGSGEFWHWDHQYVHRWNLWWHFGRFAKAIEGLDPAAERFRPFYTETPRLRVYGLAGVRTTVAWCRDKASDWKSELEEGRPAAVVEGEKFPASRVELSCYLPWEDRSVTCAAPVLPPFRRSIVVRYPTVPR